MSVLNSISILIQQKLIYLLFFAILPSSSYSKSLCDVYNSSLCSKYLSASKDSYIFVTKAELKEMELICASGYIAETETGGGNTKVKCSQLKDINDIPRYYQVSSLCKIFNYKNQHKKSKIESFYHIVGNPNPKNADIVFIGELHDNWRHSLHELISINKINDGNMVLLVEGTDKKFEESLFNNIFYEIDARLQLYFQTDVDYDPQSLAETKLDSYKKFSNFIKYELPHFSRRYGGIDRYLRYHGCNQESPYTIEEIQEIIGGSDIIFGWDFPLGIRLYLGELNVDIFQEFLASKKYDIYSLESLLAFLIIESNFLSKEISFEEVRETFNLKKESFSYSEAKDFCEIFSGYIRYKNKTLKRFKFGSIKTKSIDYALEIQSSVLKNFLVFEADLYLNFYLNKIGFALRNYRMIKTIDKYLKEKKRVVVLGGLAHSPFYGFIKKHGAKNLSSNGNGFTKRNITSSCKDDVNYFDGQANTCNYFRDKNFSILFPKELERE